MSICAFGLPVLVNSVCEVKVLKVFAPNKKVVFNDETLQDPYPTYTRLLDEGPLHYVDVGSKWAVWSVFSHAECSSIAKDPRCSAKRAQQLLLPLPLSRQAEFSELARMFSLWLIFMDPPEHTRLRKLLNKGFSSSAIEALRPQVESLVNRMLMPLKPGMWDPLESTCRHASLSIL